jgi:hypothetical protein
VNNTERKRNKAENEQAPKPNGRGFKGNDKAKHSCQNEDYAVAIAYDFHGAILPVFDQDGYLGRYAAAFLEPLMRRVLARSATLFARLGFSYC